MKKNPGRKERRRVRQAIHALSSRHYRRPHANVCLIIRRQAVP